VTEFPERNEEKTRGGYSYSLSEEEIRKYLKLSPSERLNWLEEANRFLYSAHSPKTRDIWNRFRKGLI